MEKVVGEFVQHICRMGGVVQHNISLPLHDRFKRGCLEEPEDQIAKCAVQLTASKSWPDNHVWLASLARYAEAGHAVLFIGDSTLRNKWATLLAMGVPEACSGTGGGVCYLPAGVRHDEICWRRLNASLSAEAQLKLWRTDFDAVVFNSGLKYLEVSSSMSRSSSAAFRAYTQGLEDCARKISKQFPKAKLVYKLTNAICDEKWIDTYAKRSQELRKADESAMYAMQWGRIGAATLNIAEHVAIGGPRSVAEMNVHSNNSKLPPRSWTLIGTKSLEHCECTGPRDGRHFLPLIPDFLTRLADKLWGIQAELSEGRSATNSNSGGSSRTGTSRHGTGSLSPLSRDHAEDRIMDNRAALSGWLPIELNPETGQPPW